MAIGQVDRRERPVLLGGIFEPENDNRKLDIAWSGPGAFNGRFGQTATHKGILAECGATNFQYSRNNFAMTAEGGVLRFATPKTNGRNAQEAGQRTGIEAVYGLLDGWRGVS